MGTGCSFDHLVGAQEYVRWDREAERLRRLQIDGQRGPVDRFHGSGFTTRSCWKWLWQRPTGQPYFFVGR